MCFIVDVNILLQQ